MSAGVGQVIAGVAWPTSCVKLGDVLPVKFPSPLYTATTVWLPAPSVAVLYVAVPLVTATGEPTSLPSIHNCTVPVGPLPLLGVTVVVNVTDCP